MTPIPMVSIYGTAATRITMLCVWGDAPETLYACDEILVVDHGSRDDTGRDARSVCRENPGWPSWTCRKTISGMWRPRHLAAFPCSAMSSCRSTARDGFCASNLANR